MTVVAVHQPNHLPWLGYFAKIARASIFVFLDDAQFPKGSIVNRVRVAASEPTWLTVPVTVRLGEPILSVRIAKQDWARAHRERLLQLYRFAGAFKAVWPEVEAWLAEASVEKGIAACNMLLIRRIAVRLSLGARFETSSTIGVTAHAPDARLADITCKLAPGGQYLSGRGGARYQRPEIFADRGIALTYSDFVETPYARGPHLFEPGLSVLDAAFCVGWDATAEMVRPRT